MKTTEVNKNLIGRRCECIFTGMMVTGVIEDIEENKYSVNVKVHFDKPQQWGDDLYTEDWAWGRKTDEFGTLHHLRLLADEPDFQTMTVVFGEPISKHSNKCTFYSLRFGCSFAVANTIKPQLL